MKRNTLEINIANLTETRLLKMLDDNQVDRAELMALLEALFDMWASALRFSAAVVEYGENRYDDFMEVFVNNTADNHGVSPEKLTQILHMVSGHKARLKSKRVH